jgi:heme-degrading monooxygenase HmoA
MDRQPMWVRLGSFKIKPGTTDALRARYNGEAVPKVRAYPGNIACMLLEPTGDDDSYAVITIWESRSAGEAYDASGAAKEVVDLVREFFASPPALLSYESTSSFGAAPSNGSR